MMVPMVIGKVPMKADWTCQRMHVVSWCMGTLADHHGMLQGVRDDRWIPDITDAGDQHKDNKERDVLE